MPAAWPAHQPERRPWRQSVRGGTREDRMLDHVVTQRPPLIAGADVHLDPRVAAALEPALVEVTLLDGVHAQHMIVLENLLLRGESVASSKIEGIAASTEDFAKALYGIKSNQTATLMAAGTEAISLLISSAARDAPIMLDSIRDAHGLLMRADPRENPHAGRLRDVQNWIGGSDHSPRNALFVPPAPDRVEELMRDLVSYANRHDVPALVQAAIVHAQFESIHPFTDGNGRIGRALINSSLRRRGVTSQAVVPLAAALVARRDAYFDALDAYRAGDVEPIVGQVARACEISARESRTTAVRLDALPGTWSAQLGTVRSRSAAARLLDQLTAFPVFTSTDAVERIGGATSSVYAAIARFREAGVIRPLSNRTRDPIWAVSSILDELDDLGSRIAAVARAQGGAP